jgi:hypothetical protein
MGYVLGLFTVCSISGGSVLPVCSRFVLPRGIDVHVLFTICSPFVLAGPEVEPTGNKQGTNGEQMGNKTGTEGEQMGNIGAGANRTQKKERRKNKTEARRRSDRKKKTTQHVGYTCAYVCACVYGCVYVPVRTCGYMAG